MWNLATFSLRNFCIAGVLTVRSSSVLILEWKLKDGPLLLDVLLMELRLDSRTFSAVSDICKINRKSTWHVIWMYPVGRDKQMWPTTILVNSIFWFVKSISQPWMPNNIFDSTGYLCYKVNESNGTQQCPISPICPMSIQRDFSFKNLSYPSPKLQISCYAAGVGVILMEWRLRVTFIHWACRFISPAL